MPQTAIRLTGVFKSFAGNRVLHGVDFEVRKGEVHALIGSNGAGKSTLMKVLQGVYTPDQGAIEVDGKPVHFDSPNAARAHGIGMIFQEFSLVPTLTAAQNIFLGHEFRHRGFLDDHESTRRARDIFAEMEVDIDPAAPVATLSKGYRQLTEIAKALSWNARVLIMDEPNAALAKGETQVLFHLVRRLQQQGIAIVYITHRMEEVFEIADRITVLRDGRRITTEPVANISLSQLIGHIVGRKVEHTFLWRPRRVERVGIPLLEVNNLVAGDRVRGVSFKLHRGEILGVAGLVGSGRSETVQAIFGIGRIDSGEVRINGRSVEMKGPGHSIRAGLGLVPEDRRIQGLVLDHSIRDNILLPILPLLQRWGLVKDGQGDQIVVSSVKELKIETDSIRKPVGLLSGGNAQKVVLAKWLSTKPDILILDEPTAGVDIGTKGQIVDIIRQLADSQKGIIMISSELPELLAVSDRILVLRGGRIARELDRSEVDSHLGEVEEGRIGVAEETLNRIVQGESQIVGTGPLGETATPAAEIGLSNDEIEGIKTKKATAAILFHHTGSDLVQGQLEGLRAQFARMDVEIIGVADALFKPENQIADLEKLLAKKPDVIVALPADPALTAQAFRKVAAAGTKLVFIDSVPQGMRHAEDYVSVVSADNYGCGQATAYLMADGLSGRGKVGIVFHSAEWFATRQRHDAFRDTLTKYYPGIEIIAEEGVAGPDFTADAESVGRAMLAGHPEIDGIWAVWDEVALGVVSAALAAGRNDLVVTTIDYGEKVATLLAGGQFVIGLSAQRAYDQGMAAAILAGYGLVDKAAPAYVAQPSLTVTRENIVSAWRTVYRKDPPRSLMPK